MDLFFTKKFYCCLLVFASLIAGAQTKFTATVSPAQACRDEYVTLRLTVANGSDIQNIQPPALDNFNIISGPNQETEMNSVNGVTEQFVSLSYVLQPKKTGTINIASAAAIVAGKAYRSNALTINVSNKRSAAHPQNTGGLSSFMQMPMLGFDPFDGPREEPQYNDYILHKGENVQEKVSRNMQLRLQTDKVSCYVGEPVLATYKLYSRLKSESTLSKNPSFNGFSVIDMTQNDPGAHSIETLNGRQYNVYMIRKAQLYPLQAGQIALETATLDNKISFLKADNNSFDNSGANLVTENVSLSSKPVTINVKPLPEEGRPANFKGAVGEFKIESALEKNSFSSDESGRLLITISGKGNMQLITAPEIKWADGIESFDAKTADNTDNTSIPLSGSKTFEIPFTVEKSGAYSIPAISFSYFDPPTSQYKTASSPQISFTVSQGTGKKQHELLAANNENGSLLAEIFSKRWLLILLLAFIVITGFVFWMRKEKKAQDSFEKIKSQEQNAVFSNDNEPVFFSGQNPLAQTEDCLNKEECPEFYSILNGELRAYLAAKFSVPKDSLTVKSLAAAMDKAEISNNSILQTQQLLQDIEWQVYTPFEQNEKLHEMYARAQTILQLLNMRKA